MRKEMWLKILMGNIWERDGIENIDENIWGIYEDRNLIKMLIDIDMK